MRDIVSMSEFVRESRHSEAERKLELVLKNLKLHVTVIDPLNSDSAECEVDGPDGSVFNFRYDGETDVLVVNGDDGDFSADWPLNSAEWSELTKFVSAK